MKASLHFNLPEDEEAHRRALEGMEYFALLRRLDEHLRTRLKYGELPESARHELEETRALLREEGIDLDG